ncbi:MAG: dihydrofolate reductase family protein [Methanoculleus sp.]
MFKGLLHFYRTMEHTKDVVILVSEATPEDYLDYLREREYPFIRCGKSRVDLKEALQELGERFGVAKMVSDSGPDLNDVLVQEGLVDTISLIVYPVIAGEREKRLFGRAGEGWCSNSRRPCRWGRGRVHLVYAVKK